MFQENTGEQQNQILDLQEATQIPEGEVKQRELTHTYRVKQLSMIIKQSTCIVNKASRRYK